MKQYSIKFNYYILFTICCFLIVFVSCKGKRTTDRSDTPTSGKIIIVADETFKSIIDYEIQVFEKIYLYAYIKCKYKTEVDAFNYLLKDSVNMIIASRKLNNNERKYFKDKNIFPRETKIAVDAVALIVNKQNPDTFITVNNFRKILLGDISKWSEINPLSQLGDIKLVFDNTNSSTVRYVIDSITKTSKLSRNLSAMTYNLDVVDFVSKNQNAIGVIGVSWVNDKTDSTALSFMKNVNVMWVSKAEIAKYENSFQPYQGYIANKSYPFIREIYALDCDPRTGLASGFASFLASYRGQKIILKAGILPATQPIRLVEVRKDF